MVTIFHLTTTIQALLKIVRLQLRLQRRLVVFVKFLANPHRPPDLSHLLALLPRLQWTTMMT
jgi:hypothetical protein